MRSWRRIRHWLRSRRQARELAAEMLIHREMLERQFEQEGMSRREARRAAGQRFGNASAMMEYSRDQWSFLRMESIIKDIRFAGRVMLRQPLLTAIATLTIAVGVGANTAIVSAIHVALLNPLGLPHTDRVVAATVGIEKLQMHHTQTSGVEFRELQSMTDVFSAVAAIEGHYWTSEVYGDATRLVGQEVTPDFFRVFNVQPELGRFFVPEDRYAAVLSHGLWESQFGGDSSAVGRIIMLDGVPHRIAGVAPAAFRFPVNAQLWTPLILSPQRLQNRGYNMQLWVFGLLKDGVSELQAVDRVKRHVAGLKSSGTGEGKELAEFGYTIDIESFARFSAGDLRSPLWLLWAAASVLLIAGCANVAGLLLTRSSARRREIAIRFSLGASRSRIVRQLLLESLMLGLMGGTFGLAMAAAILPSFTKIPIPHGQILALLKLDQPLLLYGLGLALFTALLFGLAPALQLARETQTTAMARSHRRRFQNLFVVLQVGGAFVLVVFAALFLRSLWTIEQISPGFDTKNLTTAYFLKPKNDPGFLDRLQLALRSAPGVESAALAYPVPFAGGGLTSGFDIRNREKRPGEPEWHGEAYFISPDYLATLRIPLLRGRGILDSDGADAPLVCLVDSKLAQRFFPNQDPLGQEISMYKDWARIVGVVSTIRGTTLEEGSRPVVYYSLPQIPFFPQAGIVARSNASPVATIRGLMRRTNAAAPLFDIRTMEDRIGESLGIRRMMMLLLSAFGSITLLLAAIGLYGIVAQVVTERTQEIGIRMALGARRPQIVLHFMREGMYSGTIGLALGLVAAAWAQKWLSGMLYQVKPSDMGSFAVTAGGILAILSIALWWPARRASHIDPHEALRHE